MNKFAKAFLMIAMISATLVANTYAEEEHTEETASETEKPAAE
jgi:hypothetical protein